MADNTLAILRHLTSAETSIEKIEKSANTVYFSLLGGLAFVMMPAQTATIIYVTMAVMTLTYVLTRCRRNRLELYGVSFVSIFLSGLLSILAPNVVAFVASVLLKRPLTW